MRGRASARRRSSSATTTRRCGPRRRRRWPRNEKGRRAGALFRGCRCEWLLLLHALGVGDELTVREDDVAVEVRRRPFGDRGGRVFDPILAYAFEAIAGGRRATAEALVGVGDEGMAPAVVQREGADVGRAEILRENVLNRDRDRRERGRRIVFVH